MGSAASVEVRLKLHRILAEWREYCIHDTECIRTLRAIQCLEMIGTAKSFAALQRISRGEPDSIVTQDSKAAVSRLTDWVQAE